MWKLSALVALPTPPPSGKVTEDARHRARGACKRAVERETGKEAVRARGREGENRGERSKPGLPSISAAKGTKP